MKRRDRRRTRHRPQRSPAEYFLAAVGALLLVAVAVVLATPSSCHSPTGPATPTPASGR